MYRERYRYYIICSGVLSPWPPRGAQSSERTRRRPGRKSREASVCPQY